MHVKLRLGLMTAAAVTLSVVVTGTSYFSVAALIEDQNWLTHSRSVIGEFHNLLFRMSAAAADERTYLLNGEKDDLDDYRKQVKNTFASVATLKELVKDNVAQTTTLAALAQVVEQRIKLFDSTLDILQKEGRDAAYKRVREEQTSVLDQVGQLEQAFEIEENRLLMAREQELLHSVRATQLTLLAGCLLSIAIIAAFNFYFGRHIVACIRRLLNVAENAENGRFTEIKIESSDEFRELGDAFNQLSLTLDSLNRKVKALEIDNVQMIELRPLTGPLEQAVKLNSQLTTFAKDVKAPVDAALQKAGSIYRNTNEVRRLLNTADENLSALKASIEECSLQADRLAGLQSELDNISNALEVISMSVDMTAPDGQPVLGAVMTRLHELSERCHDQRQTVGESVTRMQTLLSRAMLTTHASSGAESTGRQMLGGVNDTVDSLARELEQCRTHSNLVTQSIATQTELLSTCRDVLEKINNAHPAQSEVVKKLQASLEQTTGSMPLPPRNLSI
jgi:CHASE3 domain sensor protein